jgi:ribosome modulation factor
MERKMDSNPEFTGERLLRLVLDIEAAVGRNEAGCTPLGMAVIKLAEAAFEADKKDHMSPWNEGHQARLKGDDRHTNPYVNGTKECSEWSEGWHDLDEHLRDRDDALRSIGWH